MFERYTERARRTIFYARYEASQFGSSHIETEHLLLGLFREDKDLARQFMASFATLEDLRGSMTWLKNSGVKISTSVDLPLSHESKRVLAYGAEESERMNQKHIGPGHLLLGLLREEKCAAGRFLREQGVTEEVVRKHVHESEHPTGGGKAAWIAGLNEWVAEHRLQDSTWTILPKRIGTGKPFVLYAAELPKHDENEELTASAKELAEIQKRIEFIVERMENAIANHEFEKARLYDDEERKEREHLRRRCDELGVEQPPARTARLCIDVTGEGLFSDIRKRCDEYLATGAAEVWLLDRGTKRAYTVTKADGLREFRGEVLRFENPPLEMDLRRIFGQG